MVGITITSAVVIIAAISVIVVANKIRRAVTPVVNILKHIDPEKMENEIQTTPKSVNAMTSVYLPRIEKDFPEFNYFEFKARAENMLKSAFVAISSEDIEKLINASSELKTQIGNTIAHNKVNSFKESYRNIVIHRTEIKNYTKNSGSCIITLQSSVGYIHSVKNSEGEVIKGDDENMFQTRYDTELAYIQDVEKTKEGVSFVANTCPNCGAPIKSLGYKGCPYCGSAVESINIRTWAINKLTEC